MVKTTGNVMRSRIVNRGLLANFQGLYKRRFASQSHVSEKLSLILAPETTKESVTERLDQHLGTASKNLRLEEVKGANHGAAIVASQQFTTWLDDDAFMSSLLKTLFKSTANGQSQPQDIDVLTAVTNSIAPKRLLGEPQTGFSILYGSAARILPELWNRDTFGSNVDQDRASSISFLSGPLSGDTRPLEITLPLANTIFHNGRTSTLFASRWQRGADRSLTLTKMDEKHSQTILPGRASSHHTSSLLPLLPLTPPRKVVAGLGNIVRQVEVDGSPTPASKELEILIPEVLDARSNQHGESSPGPIGVWCWVVPPHVVEAQGLRDLKVFQDGSSTSEAELALSAMDAFSRLLSSGCRLHKILSGGGGWGAKQGLLSLDPETIYKYPDEESLDMFIRSFNEPDNSEISESLITPGSYVIFCIEPHWTSKDVEASQMLGPVTAIGVDPNKEIELYSNSVPGVVEIVDGHFGAFSTAGLFLKAQESASIITTPQPFTTKVDASRACFLI
ncbi:hypothetical protein F5B20DRAFT_553420 [Whalleya microplaca]|nr:hypothetical protein F5B20DRAFT_553420 [Whalleya microplaca]